MRSTLQREIINMILIIFSYLILFLALGMLFVAFIFCCYLHCQPQLERWEWSDLIPYLFRGDRTAFASDLCLKRGQYRLGKHVVYPNVERLMTEEEKRKVLIDDGIGLRDELVHRLAEHCRVSRVTNVEYTHVQACWMHAPPVWLPVPLNSDSNLGYCDCHDLQLVSPFYRSGEAKYVCVVGSVHGFLVVDRTRVPNYVRKSAHIELGVPEKQPVDWVELGWFEKFMCTIDRLRIHYLRKESLNQVRIGLFPFHPEAILWYRRVAATMGDSVMRREISAELLGNGLSPEAFRSFELSLSMVGLMNDRTWLTTSVGNQGSVWDTWNWLTLEIVEEYQQAPDRPSERVPSKLEEKGREDESGTDDDLEQMVNEYEKPVEAEDDVNVENTIKELNDGDPTPRTFDLPAPQEFLSEELKFESAPATMYPARVDWQGAECAPRGPEDVAIVAKKNMKPNKSSGVEVGVEFGRVPMVMGSDSVTQLNAVLGRLTAELPGGDVHYGGQKLPLITAKQLYWPKHLTVDQRWLSKEFTEVFDHKGDLVSLMANMKPRSRKRMLRVLDDVMSGRAEWDAETKAIKIFVKSDDKVFKAKPRIIQFVNSIVWLRVVLKVSGLLKRIKSQEGWSWYDRHSKKRFIWASGQTQKDLSGTFEKFLKECEDIVALCGDDNTDEEGANDAGKYDSTQKGIFLARQLHLLSLMGFSKDELEEIVRIHTSPRKADGFMFFLSHAVLPSGAPWTLFLNTIGLVVFHRQLALVRERLPDVDDGVRVRLSGAILGLDMKNEKNPNLGEITFNGAEFLKGVFVRIRDRVFWTPLPSRLCKWGSRNYAHPDIPRTDIVQHIAQVCKGQDPFLLDPMCRKFVDGWKDLTKSKAIVPDWMNVTAETQLELPAEFQTEWAEWWEKFYQDRYGITKEQMDQMLRQIGDGIGRTGKYTGRAWAALADRDYAGVLPVASQ